MLPTEEQSLNHCRLGTRLKICLQGCPKKEYWHLFPYSLCHKEDEKYLDKWTWRTLQDWSKSESQDKTTTPLLNPWLLKVEEDNVLPCHPNAKKRVPGRVKTPAVFPRSSYKTDRHKGKRKKLGSKIKYRLLRGYLTHTKIIKVRGKEPSQHRMPLGKAGKNKARSPGLTCCRYIWPFCPSCISLVYLKEDGLLNDSSWVRFAAMENLYASVSL